MGPRSGKVSAAGPHSVQVFLPHGPYNQPDSMTLDVSVVAKDAGEK